MSAREARCSAIRLQSPQESVEAELNTLQFSIITMRVVSGARNARHPFRPAKLSESRELENEYLEGGEVALYSDNLTFEQLAEHCQQTKYCEAEYDVSGNKLFGVRDTTVYEAHLKHFKEFFGKMRVRDIPNLDGYDIRTIQELLGHQEVATTMICTHAETPVAKASGVPCKHSEPRRFGFMRIRINRAA